MLDEGLESLEAGKLHFPLPHSTRQSYAHFYTRFCTRRPTVGREISLGMLKQTLIFSLFPIPSVEESTNVAPSDARPALHSSRVGGGPSITVWPPVNHVPPEEQSQQASQIGGLWPSPSLPRAGVRLARPARAPLLPSGPHAVTHSFTHFTDNRAPTLLSIFTLPWFCFHKRTSGYIFRKYREENMPLESPLHFSKYFTIAIYLPPKFIIIIYIGQKVHLGSFFLLTVWKTQMNFFGQPNTICICTCVSHHV